jgi:hypothetical protein
MITSSVVLAAVGIPLLLWAIGRAVTAAGERVAPGLGPSRQYLAGRSPTEDNRGIAGPIGVFRAISLD